LHAAKDALAAAIRDHDTGGPCIGGQVMTGLTVRVMVVQSAANPLTTRRENHTTFGVQQVDHPKLFAISNCMQRALNRLKV
jgi:hypothetical protein